MGVGSGLGAQLVIGEESGYGGSATLDHSYEFDSESLAFNPTWLTSTGLHGGGDFPRGARTVQSVVESAGSIPLDFTTNKMGLLVKHMLGSTPTVTQIGSTAAWKQIHQVGSLTGKSLAAQVGRPQTDGTVKPFTNVGSKILQWALSCNAQQLLKLALDLNCQNEVTSTGLAAFSPVAAAVTFNWKQSQILLGGTASTTSGVVAIAGGTALTTLVTGFTLTGANPMKTDRYGMGGSGLKSEPLANAFRDGYSLALDGEFTSQSEIYDPFKAQTKPPVEIIFTGGAIGGGNNFLVDIVIPQVVLKKAAPTVGGPDVVTQSIQMDITDDGVNAAPIQITIVSTDTAL